MEAVTAQAPVSERAKLLRFETVLSESGEVAGLSFAAVEQVDEKYVHTDAVYDAEKQVLRLERNSTEEWLQYHRQIDAERFFGRVVELDLLRLRLAGEHPYVKLELMEDGTQVNYGIRDRNAFVVDGEGVTEIRDEQLPVQGYWISACGMGMADDRFAGCEDPSDYLFDFTAPLRDKDGT